LLIDPVVERSSMIIYADQLNKYLLDHKDDCGHENGTKNFLEGLCPAIWRVSAANVSKRTSYRTKEMIIHPNT
jgi:hypothetical protein